MQQNWRGGPDGFLKESEMDKLKQLLERCKCGVFLTVNEHRDYYETPEQRLDWYAAGECPPDMPDDVRAGILATGNIVDLQFYPQTPIGSYQIVHYDLDAALEQALECVPDISGSAL